MSPISTMFIAFCVLYTEHLDGLGRLRLEFNMSSILGSVVLCSIGINFGFGGLSAEFSIHTDTNYPDLLL